MSQEKPISGFRDRLAALRISSASIGSFCQLMDSDSLKGFVGCTTFSAMFEVLCVQMFVSFKKTFWN
ncbi:hypothetical protein KXD40_005278 [Peronospora effusa]|nr:hypothetical protein KXD40_005278 [Peronospora effusa]